MTIYIAPDCPADLDAQIRADAAQRREDVMPRRPFPWNRLRTDQKVVAERKWQAGLKPAKPQKACDIGLFSDDAAQLDLCEMFQQPVEDGQ